MSFLAEVLAKLLIPEEVDTQMSKMPYIKTRFCKQGVSGYEILIKSVRHHYYRMISGIWDKSTRETSVLFRSKVLGVFVNTLTAEYMHSCHNMQNFPPTT